MLDFKRGINATTQWMAICLLLLFAAASCLRAQTAVGYQPAIPNVWDDAVMKDLEVPLGRSEFSPRHVPASFYYQIPVRPIYKSYPVYHPDREPKGYIEGLRLREPELDWDASTLKTKEDWIRAGETVFDAPLGWGSLFLTKERLADVEDLYVRTPTFLSAVQPPVSADGILHFFRYVVRKRRHPRRGICLRYVPHPSDAGWQRGERGAGEFPVRQGDGVRNPVRGSRHDRA
jgi:hypothetical protein